MFGVSPRSIVRLWNSYKGVKQNKKLRGQETRFTLGSFAGHLFCCLGDCNCKTNVEASRLLFIFFLFFFHSLQLTIKEKTKLIVVGIIACHFNCTSCRAALPPLLLVTVWKTPPVGSPSLINFFWLFDKQKVCFFPTVYQPWPKGSIIGVGILLANITLTTVFDVHKF